MLINLRNALMAGKRLPYDAEVEYLESSGTQWIDTGTPIAYADKIELTFATTASGTQYIFGDSISGNSLYRWAQTSANKFAIMTGNGSTIGTPPSISTNTVYTARVENKNCYLDSALFATIANADPSTPRTEHAYLFTWNSSTITGGKVRIYSCKIYDANGALVRDYIPVRKGTVGYLYDRVSGKLFGNAGTGDFVLGQDVVPVEYIESHGTEYIDTGMYLTTSFEYDLKFRMNTPLTSGTKSFGLQYHTWSGSYPMWCIGVITYNKPRVFANMSAGGNTASGVDVGWGYDADITMSLHGNTLTYNGTDITFARWNNSETSLDTMKIFVEQISRSGGRLLDFAYARCYFLDLYSGNGDSRKFRPVRVGTDGAMMDVLTRRIYRNAGTGAFTYGNDLKYPIPAE